MADNRTTELRNLLDERGVEYRTHYLHTSWCVGPKLYLAVDNLDGTLTVGNLTPEQAIAATLGRPKARAHPYGYEPDTGAFDCTRCECGCINDISATYCNDCGGEIEIDKSAEKEIYHHPRNSVFAEKHDDGSLEFGGKRYIAATLGNDKKLITIALQLVRDHYCYAERFDESCIELERWCHDHGETDLMEYAMALRCPACAFVPMDDGRSTSHERQIRRIP